MRRLAENQEAKLEKQDSNEPNSKKSRSENKIATLDNGTLVEALKFLNYCQLAKKSQISKKFRDLIRTHRHSLALLNVFIIRMGHAPLGHYPIEVFDKELSPEEYNKWVICNGYSKQISLESQAAEKESQIYGLEAYADYNGSHFSGVIVTHVTSFFKARAGVNHENWPLFQHFVRLLTDSFIYIQSMELAYQSDVLNLLALAIGRDHSRIQCQRLEFNLRGISIFNLMNWIKGHVLCNEFQIYDYSRSDCDQELLAQELLELFATGANCTSKIVVKHYNFSKVLKDMVKVNYR
ncbi:hypothetical protein Ddc_15351 [Ditylenchus destructor]|nr:hypothetical protein Ddc_15351 [Ditylenchus destructor]